VPQTWSYNERGFLSRLRVGSATPGQVFDRSYSYDGVGNITSILDNRDSARQTFRYDERDRLTSASAISSTIASGTTVTVRARGQDGGGWPTMKLRVNGTVVQTWTVNNANWANYTHTLTSAIGPTDLVDIVYDNNATSTGDRNLFVDYIQFGSATPIQAEARTVTYDRNATDGNDLWASDGLMFWDGALRLTQKYSYNALGNLTHKEGATYGYGTQSSGCAAGALTKPHALVNGGGVGYCYDQNGNMVSGGGRTIAWNAENLPSSVTSGGVTESYTYNPDSARVKKVRNSVTTIYVEGLYEEEIGGSGTITKYYTLNGQTVAQRTRVGTNDTVTYMHGDHLGSVSAVTNTSGVATLQEFDVWGLQRVTASQAIPTFISTRNYTGQIRDETGLLFYNARYYDPAIGRFISGDTVVPGTPSGTMNGVAVTPLTVSFHEGMFLNKANSENKAPFWFQMDGDAKQQYGSPMGPANPQALNRYSYVQNNPLKYTDPSGHQLVRGQHVLDAWEQWHIEEQRRIDQKYAQSSQALHDFIQDLIVQIENGIAMRADQLREMINQIKDVNAKNALLAAVDVIEDYLNGLTVANLMQLNLFAQAYLIHLRSVERSYASYRYFMALSSHSSGLPIDPPPGYACDENRCWKK
jgi:RHS repeat-associated protein